MGYYDNPYHGQEEAMAHVFKKILKEGTLPKLIPNTSPERLEEIAAEFIDFIENYDGTQRQEFREICAYWEEQVRPLREAIAATTHLTAEDYAITINTMA